MTRTGLGEIRVKTGFTLEKRSTRSFLAWSDYIKNNGTFEEKDLCKENMKYRAVVNVQLAVATVSRTTQDLRQRFADKISTFGEKRTVCQEFDNNCFITGGTLGLFTGMSILSMVEVAFWIMRYHVKAN